MTDYSSILQMQLLFCLNDGVKMLTHYTWGKGYFLKDLECI